MKSVTVHQLESNFAEVLRLVEAGAEVQVVRRRQRVAKIVPIPLTRMIRTADWSDIGVRLSKLWGHRPAPGKPASQIIRDHRR